MKSEKFEEWFDVAFDRAVSSSSLTSDESKRASWKKVQAQLDQVKRKRKQRRRLQLSGIVAASFIAGAVFFSPSGVTKALSPIVQSVVDLGNGMIGIVIKNGDVPPSLVTPKTEKTGYVRRTKQRRGQLLPFGMVRSPGKRRSTP
ncbi:hypothetical protein VQ056_13815 [Paenibacillus sp. JTLBN-2024]